jgi:hypothetical protein
MDYKISLEPIDTEKLLKNMQYCKDIIEAFKDILDDFTICRYEVGYLRNNTFYGYSEYEDDKVAIRFWLGLHKNYNNNYFADYKVPFTKEQIDDSILLLNRAKLMLGRLSKYCPDINFKFNGTHSEFILPFENTDHENIKQTLLNRLIKKINNNISDYSNYKTIEISFSVNNGVNEKRYDKLFNLLKEHIKLKGILSNKLSGPLNLRYSATTSMVDDNIYIKIGDFKFTEGYYSKYSPIKFDRHVRDEAINHACIRIINGIFSNSDKDKMDVTIDGDIIKIKALI